MAQTTEIEKLERRHAEHPEGRTFAPLANAYRKRGEVARALELLASGLERHPGYIGAQIVLGLCHADLGADREAAAAFESVLGTDPENVIALKALADVAERAGRLDQARSRLAFLLEIDRGNVEARQQLERLAGLADTAGTAEVPEGIGAPAEASGAATEPMDSLVADEPGLEELDGSAESPEGLELTNSFSSDGIEHEMSDTPDDALVRTEGLEPGEFEGSDEIAPLEGLDPPTEAPFGGMIIEREADIELEAHEGNEFQMSDAARELQASLPDEDTSGGWGALEPLDEPIEPADLDSDLDADLDAPEIMLDGDYGDEDDAPDLIEPVLAGPPDDDLLPVEEVDDAPESVSASTAFLMDDELVPAATGPVDEAAPAETTEGLPGLEVSGADEPDDELDDEMDEEPDEEPVPFEPAVPAIPAAAVVPIAHEDPEPELVVTETMAEIYERQGLHEDALRVYRALAERRPRDESLVTRIQRLESVVREQVAAATPPPQAPSRPDWSGGSGSGKAGSFFRSVLGAGLAPAGPTPAPARSPHRSGEHSGDDAAPTRPAADPVSLGAVFGEEMPPSTPASSQASGSAAGNGFSFDAFFGSGTGGRDQQQGGARGGGEQEDLAQFHAWLQSLKG